MSVNIYDKSTDTLEKVAGSGKIYTWTGTRAEYEAEKDTMPDGCYVNITDDIEDVNKTIETGVITITVNGVGTLGSNYYATAAVSKSFSKVFNSTPVILTAPQGNPNGNAILSASVSATKEGITNVWLNLATNVTGNFSISYVAIEA